MHGKKTREPLPVLLLEAKMTRNQLEVPFSGEGQRKVLARQRVAGVRSSKARVLRLMRRAQLLAFQLLALQPGA